MFNLTEYKARVKTDYSHPAWDLLERVLEELQKRGVDPYYINSVHVPQAYDKEQSLGEVGQTYIGLETVYRNNGTEQNVSVKIHRNVVTGKTSARRTISVKVPKNASVKVINNRIDKVLGGLS